MSLINENSKMTPTVRSPKYSDSWAVAKIGDVFQVYSGQTPNTSDANNFVNATVPWIRTTDLTNGLVREVSQKISESAAIKLKTIPAGTVLIAMYGGLKQIGRTGLVMVPSTINQALSALCPVATVDPYFLLTELNGRVSEWRPFAASSRKDPNITKKNVQQFKLYLPKITEQQSISETIHAVDTFLFLHQRKLSGLQQARHWAEQNLLPEPNETTPKVRVGEFAVEWKRVPIGNILERDTERNNGQFSVSQTLSIATMTYKAEGNGADASSLANYKVCRVGDVAFEGHTNKFFQYGRFILNKTGDGIISPRFTAFRFKDTAQQDLDFWKTYLHYEPAIHQLLAHSTKLGTMMNEIMPDFLFRQPISVPSLAEQRAIAKVFNTVDARIKSEQQLIANLKEIKRWALDNMFV